MGVLLMARREELLKPKDANLADDSEDDDNCACHWLIDTTT